MSLKTLLFIALSYLSCTLVIAQQDTAFNHSNLTQLLQNAKQKSYSQPIQAVELFEQLLKISEIEKDYAVYCECIKQLSMQKMGKADFNAARDLIVKGMQIADGQQLNNFKADFNFISGSLFYAQGNMPAAVQKWKI